MSTFIPKAIGDLSEAQARALASSPRHLEGWREIERARCAESFTYFVEAYGSVEPGTGAIPFDPWDAQREVMASMEDQERLVILKARQLGLSWLALHRAVWLAAFADDGEGSRVLIACKNQSDASGQLRRARRIIERLPDWLRPELGTDSATRIDFPSRAGASIRVLTANPESVRGETCSLLILDEFAFTARAQQVWTAALPAVEHGQLIVVSTANGVTGDGAPFHQLWEAASEGEGNLHAIFLPWSAHPERDGEWVERTRRAMLDPELFAQEYPGTADEAFAANADKAVFPSSHIASAIRLGQYAEKRETGCEVGIDWGDVQTAAAYIQELDTEGGGVFVVGELVQARTEPRRAATHALQTAADRFGRIEYAACDSLAAGTARTGYEALQDLHRAEPSRYPRDLVTVNFSQFKEGGNASRGVDTVGYIRWLLWNTYESERLGEVVGPRIAIDPETASTLVSQMKGLVRDDRGRIAKPPLDPKRPEKGDHVVDGLIAVCAARALARWQAEPEAERQSQPPPDDRQWLSL